MILYKTALTVTNVYVNLLLTLKAVCLRLVFIYDK